MADRACPWVLLLVLAGCPSNDSAVNRTVAMEAQVMLRSMVLGARAYYQQEHAAPVLLAPGVATSIVQGFPHSTRLTPNYCCDPVCEPDGRQWDSPGWRELRMEASTPLRYRYQFESSGQGPGAHFTARAVRGCPEPDEVWEIEGHVNEYGQVLAGEIHRVR